MIQCISLVGETGDEVTCALEYSSTGKSDALERLACGEPFHGSHGDAADDDDANIHAY